MRTHTTITKSLVIVVALATTLSLSGCFTNPLDQLGDTISEGIAEGGTEKLIEGMTGGEIDIETDGSLPQDFPAEVPVIDGAIMSAAGVKIEGRDTWQITIGVEDTASAMQLGREKLVNAGFEEDSWADSSAMMIGVFSNDGYRVHLAAAGEIDGDNVVSYQVYVTDGGE